MFCPSCGKEIANGSVFCNFCGKRTNSFFVNDNKNETKDENHPYRINMGSSTNEVNASQTKNEPEPNYQEIAIRKELNDWKNKNVKVFIIIGAIFGIMALTGHLVNMPFEGIWVCLSISLLSFFYVYNRHDHINKLERKLAVVTDKRKKIKLCPYCKSPTIEMNMVQAGNTISQGKTTISENINPLRPFTHVNVNHGNVNTHTRYKTMYNCLNCGKVFQNPQIMYEK